MIAFEAEQPIGCGAFRELANKQIEIKRMFVHPTYRGKGISKQILGELEAWAREHRYEKAILETGIRQPEAIQLYKRMGYNSMANYAPYQGMPESVCLQKDLTEGSREMVYYLQQADQG